MFWNLSIFDKYYFESMFGEMVYPDWETTPNWESVNYLQKTYINWFRNERQKMPMAFPVISFSLLTDEEGHYRDEKMFDFMCDSFAKGDDSFVYNSTSADSLASCCRLKNEIDVKEFNFTNGNIGVKTGSTSVMTINLNRLAQMAGTQEKFFEELANTVKRIHKYQIAFKECIWDCVNKKQIATFISGALDLDDQFLTTGLNGINEAAEFFGLDLSDNDEYAAFFDKVGDVINRCDNEDNGYYFKHKVKFNCEFVPAESLGVKNYKWDKKDHLKVNNKRGLYGSYVFDQTRNYDLFEKIRMHGSKFLGHMGGGSACHLQLDHALDKEQYKLMFEYAAKVGCSYLTPNLTNFVCKECNKTYFYKKEACTCGCTEFDETDKIIGYRTKSKYWSSDRQKYRLKWARN